MEEKVDPKKLRLIARILIAILRVFVGGKSVSVVEVDGGKEDDEKAEGGNCEVSQ